MLEDFKPFKVQVFKDWDSETNSGVTLLSESGRFAIPMDALTASKFENPLEVR